jgi:hypothetical protein
MRNPWGEAAVTIMRNGQRWRRLKGGLLTFETARGGVFVLQRESFKR